MTQPTIEFLGIRGLVKFILNLLSPLVANRDTVKPGLLIKFSPDEVPNLWDCPNQRITFPSRTIDITELELGFRPELVIQMGDE